MCLTCGPVSGLGGLRVAIAWGENLRIFPEIRIPRRQRSFGTGASRALSHDEQQAVAACLLELGRS
jgi:hypothetical protein